MKLTIAIPTYNRNEILKRSLALLLPQLTPDCELLIIDNCSDVLVENTLKDLFQKYPEIKKRITRNRVNIGGNANILRCFELCETEWLWCLGDDDLVVSNALELIMGCIAEFPKAIFLNFLTPVFNRPVRRRSCGLQEFIRIMDHFCNILCVSVSVFRLEPLLPNMRYGYQYAYSCAPHVALLLASIGVNGECVLLEKNLLSKIAAAGIGRHWSLIDAALPIFTLQQLPGLGPSRRLLAGHLAGIAGFGGVVFQLAQLRLRGMPAAEALYLYDEYARQYWLATRRKRILFLSLMCKSCIAWPKIGDRLLRLAITAKKLKPEDYVTSDRD
jgi:glycosyltransferase involved in cell wall biosynthesis